VTRHHDLAADIEQIDVASPPALRRGQGLDGIIGQQPDITPGSATELSDDERDELERCEGIIERGLPVFFEVGAALLRVRDLRLYRGSYATFEDYCQARWGFSKTYANNLIAATSVRNNLTTIVVKTLPSNEAQTRPLAKLKTPEQQQQAWQRAVETAPDGRVTAAHVAAVVRDMRRQDVPPARGTAEADTETANRSADVPPDVDTEPWPDSLEEIDARLIAAGWDRVVQDEDVLAYQRDTETIRMVRPPAPDALHMRVAAHRNADWSALTEPLIRVGVKFDQPRSGTLPIHPETIWADGILALDTPQCDVIAELHRELVQNQGEVQAVQERLTAVQSIMMEYEDTIIRARHMQFAPDQSEIITPLLQALERVRRVIAAEPARTDTGTEGSGGR